MDDAWGGFATRYLSNLRDEYPKTTIWTWALEQSEKTTRVSSHYPIRTKFSSRAFRGWNDCFILLTTNARAFIFFPLVFGGYEQERLISKTTASLQSLIGILPSCTTYIPINIPRPSFRFPSYLKSTSLTTPWRISALIASAWETCTLPTRVKTASSRLGSLSEASAFLNASGNQQISMLELSLLSEEDVETASKTHRSDFFSNSVKYGWDGQHSHIFASSEVIRGAKHAQLHENSEKIDPPFERWVFKPLKSFSESLSPS